MFHGKFYLDVNSVSFNDAMGLRLSFHCISGQLEVCILDIDLPFLLFVGEQGWLSGETTSLPPV